MAASDKLTRKIDGILRYVLEYIEARFEHACRINPAMRHVRDDLVWQEMASMRQILASAKGFGPDKFFVVDILTSFDEKKKYALFNPTDQHNIFNEIVSEAEAEKEKQAKIEAATIRNIGDFYKAIDPSLGKAILLVQTWLWWDLPDALDLFVLDLQAERIAALRQREMTPDLLAFYRNEMNDPKADLSTQDVVNFEVKRSHEVAANFEKRRATDPGFQIIIKREAGPADALDAQILSLAQRLRVIEQVKRAGQLEPPLREHYAKVFQAAPEAVTPERVGAYEREICAGLRAKLRTQLETDSALGEPYNFKQKQLDLVRHKIAAVEAAAKG
ncbi:MAG: hypothetical protein NTW86_13205 [Candidatus Sumerlaeota bacterium]|nr:hypothetical protein [Candidatus Sumerlaeota bacterium]